MALIDFTHLLGSGCTQMKFFRIQNDVTVNIRETVVAAKRVVCSLFRSKVFALPCLSPGLFLGNRWSDLGCKMQWIEHRKIPIRGIEIFRFSEILKQSHKQEKRNFPIVKCQKRVSLLPSNTRGNIGVKRIALNSPANISGRTKSPRAEKHA